MEGNPHQFLRHENNSYHPSLSDDGSLHLGAKSDLHACPEDVFEAKQDTPAAACVVLDRAAIIQMVKPTTAKNNFDVYASQIIIQFLTTKLHDATRLDLVWDTYKDDSLKTSARSKRGKGLRRRVVAAAAIQGKWHSFVRADKNNMELFAFLTQVALKWFDEKYKQLFITDGEGVNSHSPLEDLTTTRSVQPQPPVEELTLLAPFNHSHHWRI